ncbi:MAG: cell wall protein [Chloroflexi bacterium]|nr:cell wall protein [Chloroflexota bacterium]
MKNSEIEAQVRRAFTRATPDVLDAVLSDCQAQKGRVIIMPVEKPSNPWVFRFAAIAAAFVFLFLGAAGYFIYNRDNAVASTVSLDVNPSIEITANRKERVLAVRALNEEGRTVIGDMDLTGSSLDVTVNALIGSMVRNGYLNDLANSILVSVDNADPTVGAALEEKLAREINKLLANSAFDGAVLSQTVHPSSELRKQAEIYGITLGKAQLIKLIIDKNPNYRFEDLVPLSINQLSLLASSQKLQLDSVTSIGRASEKGLIGADRAREIALQHANVSASDVVKVELDYENGVLVYEVDFVAGGFEYEYDINATNGTVIKHDKDTIVDIKSSDGTRTPRATPTASAYITAQRAKEIALAYAGVSTEDVREFEIELDDDDDDDDEIGVYEIEFKAGGDEYEFKIDARNGTILKFERDRDDDAARSASSHDDDMDDDDDGDDYDDDHHDDDHDDHDDHDDDHHDDDDDDD